MYFREQLSQLNSGCPNMSLLILIRGDADDDLVLLLSHNACKDNKKSKMDKKKRHKL